MRKMHSHYAFLFIYLCAPMLYHMRMVAFRQSQVFIYEDLTSPRRKTSLFNSPGLVPGFFYPNL